MKKVYRKAAVAFWDVILVNLALVLAIFIHNEGRIDIGRLGEYAYLLVAITGIKMIVFKRFQLYSSLWEYASIEELMKVVGAVFVGNVIGVVYSTLTTFDIFFGIYLVSFVFEIALIGGNRFSYRILRRIKQSKSLVRQDDHDNVLIIGCGSTASLIATEIKSNPRQYGHLIGYISDDSTKYGQTIAGVKVLGNRYDILSIAKRHHINEIIVAMTSSSKELTKELLDECKRTGAKVKIMPGITEVIDGKVGMNNIRNVEIEDLLGRDPVNLNNSEIASYIEGKTVMVTGGGGSIGSELCRQIAKFSPSKLIILDIYENNAYDIQNELSREYKDHFKLEVLIASVRDRKAIFRIFEAHKPHVVFHAAAHKHVPLMERSPKEAIKNNVFGTLNVVEASNESQVERFVLISTDKAVNPTNVMGASKRLCEMIVQSMAAQSKTKFVGVRFGNVLGSNGSVIPLFKKQIEEGGPVTVTHKDIIRYFMTIPEASQLVIQAGGMAKGGELFILNMGDPVRIYDLAEDLIRLSGLKPHEDIEILVTGLRPGEKLYEELLMAEEGMQNTNHEKIFIGSPSDINFKILRANLEKMMDLIPLATDEEVKERLTVLVPTYSRLDAPSVKTVQSSEDVIKFKEQKRFIDAQSVSRIRKSSIESGTEVYANLAKENLVYSSQNY
ncbi:MAG TPA: nucleoside-diphosphate sugar epimerase [Clostridiales bacterium UBA8960]|nr:nucleoside-diphosphate sugar epimerase [Clostridiales bacterium UBA8960]